MLGSDSALGASCIRILFYKSSTTSENEAIQCNKLKYAHFMLPLNISRVFFQVDSKIVVQPLRRWVTRLPSRLLSLDTANPALYYTFQSSIMNQRPPQTLPCILNLPNPPQTIQIRRHDFVPSPAPPFHAEFECGFNLPAVPPLSVPAIHPHSWPASTFESENNL
jgi:hypothetical protein